jgi:DNA processing protein
VINKIDQYRKNILVLSHHPHIGARSIAKLRDLNCLDKVLGITESQMRSIGIPSKLIEYIISSKKSINYEEICRNLKKYSIDYIIKEDEAYPNLLKEIPDAPEILFYKGSLDCLRGIAVSVVGSRKSTIYGRKATEDIISSLVSQNIIIVSGLALGIDGIAHQATLNNNGQTIAVLGNGLDTIYPTVHTQLAQKILANNGLILSEYPPRTPSYPGNFPMRNRIIAGLSMVTIIIEASLKSGSLLTAKAALEYNREIMALPHNWYGSNGEGPNQLIKMGASILTSPTDILDYLNIKSPSKIKLIADSPQQETILNILSLEPTHVDMIILKSKLPANEVGSTLTLMEMKGLLRHIGGNMYIKKS